MGNYNVQIISARLNEKEIKNLDEFKKEFEERLGRTTSAYHATVPFIAWSDDLFGIEVSAIAQAKYNDGMDEFQEWLRPFVVGGMGSRDAWSINFSEYRKEPEILYLTEEF